MSLASRLNGTEIEILTTDGQVKGIVNQITFKPGGNTLESVKSVIIDNVWDLTMGVHIHGLQTFNASEIIRFVSIRPSNTEEINEGGTPPPNDKPLENGAAPETMLRVDAFYIVLESIGVVEFLVALESIRHQRRIGVSFSGSLLGRNGRLAYIQIATKDTVFLFDMISLGRAGFDQGLREVFANPEIEKVMHDCRAAADFLKHQYDTDLVNVFDTQVAQLLICWDSGSPANIESLSATLASHLRIRDESDGREQSSRQGEYGQRFCRRPPSEDQLRFMVKEVFYLLSLRPVLAKKLALEFRCGVEVFLTSLRDAGNLPTEANRLKLPVDFRRMVAEKRADATFFDSLDDNGQFIVHRLLLRSIPGEKLKSHFDCVKAKEFVGKINVCVNPKSKIARQLLKKMRIESEMPNLLPSINEPKELIPDNMVKETISNLEDLPPLEKCFLEESYSLPSLVPFSPSSSPKRSKTSTVDTLTPVKDMGSSKSLIPVGNVSTYPSEIPALNPPLKPPPFLAQAFSKPAVHLHSISKRRPKICCPAGREYLKCQPQQRQQEMSDPSASTDEWREADNFTVPTSRLDQDLSTQRRLRKVKALEELYRNCYLDDSLEARISADFPVSSSSSTLEIAAEGRLATPEGFHDVESWEEAVQINERPLLTPASSNDFVTDFSVIPRPTFIWPC